MPSTHHEFVIIGAGVCGIYQLSRLRDLGADVLLVERHADLGGTWYRNRYPGCRFDSESYTYGYSFSDEVLSTWNWTERFASQPETLAYLEFVADTLDLRGLMRFGAAVKSAHYVESDSLWRLDLSDGSSLSCRFLVSAMGMLSTPTAPDLPGIGSFTGTSLHSYDWPGEDLDVRGKRVAVVGTGSTGVQIVQTIAADVESLVVFQTRPAWCAPLNNHALDQAAMEGIRENYSEIFAQCAATPTGFIHGPLEESFHDRSPSERRAVWEELYAQPGFGIWLGHYRETLTDEHANAEFSEFIAEKIRGRVDDPEIAEKLIPKDHGFGVQRVAMETGYYEAYNRPNVRLVDLKEAPLEVVNTSGIVAGGEQHDVDVIIFATGFDAITGAFDAVDIRGRDGLALRDHWHEGPRTYLGIFANGFPNFFMLGGPHSASAATNFPRAIEFSVEWASALFERLVRTGALTVEATEEAEAEWTEHMGSLYAKQLLRHAKSWFTGHNENIAGRDRPRWMIYAGGAPRYREHLTQVADDGYVGLEIVAGPLVG